ncbi:hemolysin family protein [Neomegalonema sp.]|uniref:hemolysin family protein n=1 Tax=Neomegalonema sp. TaxID=2039713 RepID=UPI002626F12B|nr:hemolysin family protein [Neomegalonema sp.]MDD2868874.1 hemolysin family protein [Neomegalonema sp.]
MRRLGGYTVADAMVSRAEVEALEEGASFDEVVEAFRNGRHSRLPVYRETLDDPIGFVHVKDIFKLYGAEGGLRAFHLRDHMHAALMTPPTMPAAALLQQMRTERVHMAFVIDEYGGVDGLVTNEDLVELIVGDIVDEHDDEDVEWTREGEDAWLVDGRASIKDFEREIGVELYDEDEEVDTLGGLVTALGGRVPQTGEVVAHPDGHEFDVLEADPRRVKRLRLRVARARPEEAPAAPQTEGASSGSGEGPGGG